MNEVDLSKSANVLLKSANVDLSKSANVLLKSANIKNI